MSHARRLALASQGLDGSYSPPAGPDGAADICHRLGYVQIDTIAVVARAHHHIFWNRQPDYHEEDLDHVLSADRRVFEGWSHAASLLPTSDYRFYVNDMHAHACKQQTIDWMAANQKVIDHVRARIRAEGPLRAADFADERASRGPWWDWKPAKRALEVLLSNGELMISGRRKFQRFYDLTDRVLPAHIDREPAASTERAEWALDRTLDNHGVAGVAEFRIWNRDAASRDSALRRRIQEGTILQVALPADEGPPLYVRASDYEFSSRARQRRVHVLSPFDNLVIRRPWVRRLFDFDYTIECYVPGPKRKFGYFCLPLLWGDRFIGRLDAKAEREKQSLALRKLTFEEDLTARQIEALLPTLAAELHSYARFNNCHRIRVDAVRPTKFKSILRQTLKQTAR